MLTPDNLQLHSEAAALLLIWAANTIKEYAVYKKLQADGRLPRDESQSVVKMDSFP
jgi:hypothetical protein